MADHTTPRRPAPGPLESARLDQAHAKSIAGRLVSMRNADEPIATDVDEIRRQLAQDERYFSGWKSAC